jgi:sulfate-transporting ATPase
VKDIIQFAVLGLGTGAAYALLAQGVVLIYRGSGVVNFAHGAMAMVAAFLCFITLKQNMGWSTLPAAIVGVLVAAAIAIVFQLLVLRQLRRAAAIVRLIATLAALVIVQSAVEIKYGFDAHRVVQFLPSHVYRVAGVSVQQDRMILLAIAVAVTVALWAFVKYTRVGLAITASAQNERAVSTLGWSPEMLSTITWGIGGALAGLAGILVAPLTGLASSTFTLIVTLSALAAALLGSFRSFPLTLAGGLLMGILETEVTLHEADIQRWLHASNLTGTSRAVPFLVILIVLVVRGRSLPLRSHIAERLPRLGSWVIQWPALIVAAGITAFLTLAVFNTSWNAAVSISLSAGVVLLSIIVLVGFAGQLSLAQYAIAGLGALFAAKLAGPLPMELAILFGVLLTIPAGLLLAMPALRTRGVNLAVITLGLGFAVQEVIFNNAHYTGKVVDGGTRIGSAKLFGINVNALDHPARWSIVCLIALVLCGLMVANLRRSRTGRRLIAVRTNERAAASLGISVFSAKLYAFGVAAAIAAVGGVLIGFRSPVVTYGTFNPFASINAVGHAVIGGIGYALGSVFGAPNANRGLGTKTLESLFKLANWDLFVGGCLLVVVILAHQDGIADATCHGVRSLRDRLRRKPIETAPEKAAAEALPESASQPVPPVTLVVSDLTVRFGGVVAVDQAGFTVRPGEVVGLIGPNGAGKTTMIDAVTGFVRPASGTISLNDEHIEGSSASRRAKRGLRRSFQSLELFEDITVSENIHAGADEATQLSWVVDLFKPGRHPLPTTAVTAVREFDLQGDLGKLPSELPYGRRRLVGIARAVASGPSVLMLDEPAAGLDEFESRELARLIRRLADERKMAVLLVEHDVGLVMSTCDRIVVLDFGKVIAEGTPAQIRENPIVLAAYLGASESSEAAELEAAELEAAELAAAQHQSAELQGAQVQSGGDVSTKVEP